MTRKVFRHHFHFSFLFKNKFFCFYFFFFFNIIIIILASYSFAHRSVCCKFELVNKFYIFFVLSLALFSYFIRYAFLFRLILFDVPFTLLSGCIWQPSRSSDWRELASDDGSRNASNNNNSNDNKKKSSSNSSRYDGLLQLKRFFIVDECHPHTKAKKNIYITLTDDATIFYTTISTCLILILTEKISIWKWWKMSKHMTTYINTTAVFCSYLFDISMPRRDSKWIKKKQNWTILSNMLISILMKKKTEENKTEKNQKVLTYWRTHI